MIIEDLKQQIIPNCLDFETIKLILQGLVHYSTYEYIEILYNHRKRMII